MKGLRIDARDQDPPDRHAQQHAPQHGKRRAQKGLKMQLMPCVARPQAEMAQHAELMHARQRIGCTGGGQI